MTPKRHFLTRNDVIWRILRKYPSRGVGCSLTEELPKNEQKTSHPKITYSGNRNPWTDHYKILHAGCRSGRNHACKFWNRSVKGFWCGEGSNYGPFHWLASSPLKHSRTTVRVCDSEVDVLSIAKITQVLLLWQPYIALVCRFNGFHLCKFCSLHNGKTLYFAYNMA